MKKEDIHLGDLARLFFGEAPPVFLPEVFIRTLIEFCQRLTPSKEQVACGSCGLLRQKQVAAGYPCPHCAAEDWAVAVK